ncbi:MAG TPA: VOC family protein [Gemmatimonadaceae bacterium]|nr:VOC family protein [Gemmatimonadaceae bacterium]
MTLEASAAAESKTATVSQPLDARAVIISLTGKDLARTIAFYRDVIGFTVEYVMESDGKPTSASVRSGAARLVLNQDDGGRGWERVKGEGFAITFDTAQDIDAVAAGIKARGGTLVMEPTDMSWGVRMLRFVDPDGYRIGIWAPLKG